MEEPFLCNRSKKSKEREGIQQKLVHEIMFYNYAYIVAKQFLRKIQQEKESESIKDYKPVFDEQEDSRKREPILEAYRSIARGRQRRATYPFGNFGA